MKSSKKYKFLEHTADVKFQAFGNSIERAFSNAALALQETMTKKVKIKPIIKKRIIVFGKDKESLLYNFLEEFLFLLDSEGFILAKISTIKIVDNKLEAEVLGDKANKYRFTNDVKAVTYNDMLVKNEGKRFIVQVVVDV